MNIYKKGGKYMKKEFVIIVIFLLFIVCSSGCIDVSDKTNNTNHFIGIWEGLSYLENTTMNVTFTFYEDDTASQVTDGFHSHLFYYNYDDNSLYLTLQDFPDFEPIIYSYEFSNNYTDLNLKNESFDTLILTKQ
jgi:hypothetical protein